MWLRLHRPPNKVRRIRAECRNAKERWLFDRSKERYDKTPDAARLNEGVKLAMMQGEIGRIEGVRFIVSDCL